MDRLRRLCLVLTLASTVGATAASARPSSPLLRVTVVGDGLVTSSDGRIECAPRCSARYKRGAVRMLTAEPAPNFELERWEGACVGRARGCLVAVERTTSVRASFVRKAGYVYLAVTGPGAIAVEPGGALARGAGWYRIGLGAPVTLTPQPDPGGRLTAWGHSCANAPLDGCNFVGSLEQYVTAAFGQAEPGEGSRTLTVQGGRVRSTPPGIDCPPGCTASFPAGTLVRLSTASLYPQWAGACSGNAPSCLLVLDTSLSVSVSDVPAERWPTFDALVTVSGPGIVTAAGTALRCGRRFRICAVENLISPLTARAVPARHARFAGWGGSCRGLGKQCRLTGGAGAWALFRARSR